MYQSIAAKKRKRRRLQRLALRNTIIRYGGIVFFGIVGIALGLWIVHEVLPDHQLWKALGLI